jgi:hypothetical protein
MVLQEVSIQEGYFLSEITQILVAIRLLFTNNVVARLKRALCESESEFLCFTYPAVPENPATLQVGE